MSILSIALMGADVLKQVAQPVENPGDPEISRLAADMRETLEHIGANGIAAPQVHVSKRVVVYRISAHQIPLDSTMQPLEWRVLINPLLTPVSDEKMILWERCLSVPGLHGQVARYKKVHLQAQQLDGSTFEIEAAGFHASLLQHECDHLDGVLYPMRMTNLSSLSFNSELGDKGFFIPRDPAEFVD
jgi:peptide deformylase